MTGPRWRTALALAAVPLAIGAAHALTARTVTPLWMGGSTDPTYPYVLNALLVAEGRPPALATHPGTPLQVLGAGVLRLRHALAASPLSLRDHVLTDPERFVSAIRAVLLILFVLANLLQGWAAYRLTRSLACAWAVQAASLASFLGSRTMLTVMCEPLLLSLGLVLCAWTMLVLARASPVPSTRDAVVAGAVMGAGVATKVLFAPVGLLPFLLLRTARQRLVFIACAAAVFALGIAPLGPRAGSAAAWMASSIIHTGLDTGGYGEGPGQFVDPRLFWSVLVQFLGGEWALYVLSAVAMAVALALWRTPPEARPVRNVLLLTVGIQVLILVQSAKTMGPHHLMSAVSLGGLVLALTHRLASLTLPSWPGLPAIGSAVVFAFLVGRHAYLINWYVNQRAPVRPGAVAAATLARGFGMDRVVQGYCVSTVESNLTMAHDWTWRAYAADLERLYPDALFFDWPGLHRFGRPVTTPELERRLVDGDSLILWDTPLYPLETFGFFRGLRTTELGRWRRDRLVRASLAPLQRGSTTKASAPAFAGVVMLGPLVGLDRPQPPHALGDFVPLGPVTRLAILGRGEPLRLVVESSCDEASQVATFAVDGRLMARQALARGEGWRQTILGLPARQGLFELTVTYDRIWKSEDAARPMYPGYGARHPETRWPAVRYRKIQVWVAG